MAWLRGREVVDRLSALAVQIDGGSVEVDTEAAMRRIEQACARLVAERAAVGAQVEQLVLALSQVVEGVVLTDAGGEIVFRNTIAEAYAGARHGDALVERTLVDQLRRALDGEESTETVELWGPPRRTLVISASPLSDEQRTVGALARIEDVSDRRRVETMRRDFVANISHELKTPVGALVSLSDALVDEDDPEVVRRLTGRMQREAVRLARIVEELLDLSRIEADGSAVRETVDVRQVVGDALERTRTTAEHRRVLVESAPIEPGLTVRGDPHQLVSALQNLLENAVKYSDEDTSVCIFVAAAEDEMIDIVVEDHGIGIPARDLERVFERFYRVDRARARDTGGTGLGLSIVRRVAQNHGGDILVTSREGEGSTFTFRLPAGEPAPVPPS
jgi:two-component system sensor histidine kinase SenX3